MIEEKEEAAIAAFWVSDGVDRCRVGYLPKFHVKHWKLLEGALAQIIEVYHEDSDSPKRGKSATETVDVQCQHSFPSHYFRDSPLPHEISIQEAENSTGTRRRERIQYRR